MALDRSIKSSSMTLELSSRAKVGLEAWMLEARARVESRLLDGELRLERRETLVLIGSAMLADCIPMPLPEESRLCFRGELFVSEDLRGKISSLNGEGSRTGLMAAGIC